MTDIPTDAPMDTPEDAPMDKTENPEKEKPTMKLSKKNNKNYYVQMFKKEWLNDPELRQWLRENPEDRNYCVCECCDKIFKNANRYALDIHARTRKHQKNFEKFKTVKSIFKTEPYKMRIEAGRVSFSTPNNKMNRMSDSAVKFSLKRKRVPGRDQTPRGRHSLGDMEDFADDHDDDDDMGSRRDSQLVKSTCESLLSLMPSKQEDMHDVFGKHVAGKLRILTAEKRIYAEKLINDILFDAEMGMVPEKDLIYNEASDKSFENASPEK